MNTPKFPQNCVYQHGRLSMRLADGTAICSCNFWPQVLSASTENAEDTGNPVVRFRLCIDQQPCEPERELHLADFKKLDLEALDIRCQSEGDTRRLPQLIYQIARSQLGVEDVNMIPFFSNTGWAMLSGEHVYVAGNRIISASGWVDPSYYTLASSLSALTLEVDASITMVQAAQHIRKLCRLYPGVSNILISAAVAGNLYPLFSDAGIPPRFVTYVVGPSMVKKTTLSTFIGSAYNRSTGECAQLVNLLSTTAAVHTRVSALADCCCIVDDLNASELRSEMKRREERLSEIIRTAGNATPKEKCAGNATVPQLPRGVVIVTAEYTLSAYSTMARCITLHLDRPVDNEALTPLQQRPEALSTFFFYFLQWCCGCREFLGTFVKEKLKRHRATPPHMPGMERLADAYFILDTAMDILTLFMNHIDTKHNQAIAAIRAEFHQSLNAIRQCQIRDLNQLRITSDSNRFSKLIAKLYAERQLNLCKKKKISLETQGAKDKKRLYLSLDYVTSIMQNAFQDSSITDRAITAELRKNGLLEMDKSGRSTKKVHGVRLLHIPIDRLRCYLYSGSAAQPDTEDLYHLLHGGLRNNCP